MPRPQVNSNGRMPFRNGRPAAATSADPCCCEGEPNPFWWSLWPCSEPVPGFNNGECYPGETAEADCIWITDEQLNDIYAQMLAAGDGSGVIGEGPETIVVTWQGYCYLDRGPGSTGCQWYCST